VSPINPRAIILGPNTFLAFNRGIQQVELASVDRDTTAYNFYLVVVHARRAIGHRAGATRATDSRRGLESNWLDVTARDAEDLKNTPLDCRQCHERARETPVLLMRELHGPGRISFSPIKTTPMLLPSPRASIWCTTSCTPRETNRTPPSRRKPCAKPLGSPWKVWFRCRSRSSSMQ